MITRIVFAGGAHVEVPLGVDQVRDALEQTGEGARLSELELTEHDRSGNPIRIYVNRDQVAFVMDAESVEEPSVEELPDDSSLPRSQRVTDIWGNPIRPRRRQH